MTRPLLLAALGGAAPKLYSDDVFSAFTYTTSSSELKITNGVDLLNKGGLVWEKIRNSNSTHLLIDTVRGPGKWSATNSTAAENTYTGWKFNSDGYSILAGNYFAGDSGVSWTFRQAPKFFTIVQYIGNGASNRAIAHDLGIAPGMLTSKATSTTGDWNLYHRSATGDLVLNSTAAQAGSRAIMNAADASTFTVSGSANTNGVTYIAYLWAHDPSADGIIQCGGFSGGNVVVDFGWEPQYIMLIALTVANSGRELEDTARGWTADGAINYLLANSASSEAASTFGCRLTSRGFISAGGYTGGWVYMAIRRPNKPPTSGAQVFKPRVRAGNGTVNPVSGIGFSVDLLFPKIVSGNGTGLQTLGWTDRLRGTTAHFETSTTGAEAVSGDSLVDVRSFDMNGVTFGASSSTNVNTNGANYIDLLFKRAPGFMDVVCDVGTGGTPKLVKHGLGAIPEIIIRKSRTNANIWLVYVGSKGVSDYLILNSNAGYQNDGSGLDVWTSTPPTANDFGVGSSISGNSNGQSFVSYLFATLAGISKVFGYTGNGGTQIIPCGFATGARFVLIKRTDAAGDWFIWDSARGITAGNDPHFSVNSVAGDVTTDNSVDVHASGFIVNQVAATNVNVNGATYIGLAIA